MADWAANWQALGVVISTIAVLGGGWKIWKELTSFRIQRANESLLKRTEFFLAQHRKLFDDPVLCEILQHLDGDSESLKEESMWDKKRKFLTFIEEISLLTTSKLINLPIAYYMFGYYAICAKNGKHFMTGINADKSHWRVFYDFCDKAEKFLDENNKNETLELKL